MKESGFFGGRGDQPNQAPLADLKLISWNCRGLGSTYMVNFLIGLTKTYKPSCVFLAETKCSKTYLERTSRKLGLPNTFTVEAKGRARGRALLWNYDVILDHYWSSDRIICCKVNEKGNETRWNLIATYGTLYPNEKLVF